jgi:hypothetical protein
LTLLASWRLMFLKLWDEQRGKLVGFRQARIRRRESAQGDGRERGPGAADDEPGDEATRG